MSKRLILGVLLAVVASAVTASVVVVVGQELGGGDAEKAPGRPNKAAEEFIPYTLPGTAVAGLALPVDYGRFRFVAPETEQDIKDSFPTPPPGVQKTGLDVNESARVDEFRDHDLFIEPPYIPAGWELLGVEARTIHWDDGTSWDSGFSLYYTRPEYFDITIVRRLVASDARIRIVANPAGDVTYTMSEIRGVPVVYRQDPLHVQFVQDNVITGIEAPLMHLDEFIKIADGIIAQAQEGSE